MEYSIEKTWDGDNIAHPPVTIKLQQLQPGDSFIQATVEGPFFGDPVAPSAPAGRIDELWDYEVAEMFFLNSVTQQYLEVEIDPMGHFLVLLLNGTRNMVKNDLKIDVITSLTEDGKCWTSKINIPLDFFPPGGADKFNAYAIHGSDPTREYQALYPTSKGMFEQPDFHRLSFFQHFNWKKLTNSEFQSKSSEIPAVWNLAVSDC